MALDQDWGSIKSAFPVSSGGLHPGLVPEVLDIYGTELVLLVSGGIHGHPKGTRAGAKATMQAIEAWQEGITLEEKAKKAKELGEALGEVGILQAEVNPDKYISGIIPIPGFFYQRWQTPKNRIGISLAMFHLVGIPVTGVSVNPARSQCPALLVGGDALKQVRLFCLAPVIGALIAAVIWKYGLDDTAAGG